jgi:folate-binding protein YgfZ
VDRDDHGVVEVTGRDRQTFLNALLSNEVKALGAGQGCAAAFLDVHGKVDLLLRVWVLDDRVLLVVPPSTVAAALEAFDRYFFSEKAIFRDASADWSLALLAGPGAPALAERLTGARPGEAAWTHAAGVFEGAEVRLVTGGGECGEREVWLAAPAAAGPRLRRAALEAGAVAVGEAAWESLRIEAGTPRYGRDVDNRVLLPELGADDLVSHTKGCYPGQEVVVRIRDRGHVNRHLRGLVLEGDLVPPAESEVVAGDAVVGRVTSATRSLGLGRPIALGFVRREHAAPGTALAVRASGALVPAKVSALPFAR